MGNKQKKLLCLIDKEILIYHKAETINTQIWLMNKIKLKEK